MLLNGLGRFQNALGAFQEAPERESLIFHWFWEVLVAVSPLTCTEVHGRAVPGRSGSDPLNSKKTPNTPGARAMDKHQYKGQGKHKHKGMG